MDHTETGIITPHYSVLYRLIFRLFEAATDMRHLNTWFSWASSITPVDELPLSVGKQYNVEYNLPVGRYSFLATIKELDRGR